MKEVDKIIDKIISLTESLEKYLIKENFLRVKECVDSLNTANTDFLRSIMENRLEKTVLISIYSNVNFKINHLRTNLLMKNFKGLNNNVDALKIIVNRAIEEVNKYKV